MSMKPESRMFVAGLLHTVTLIEIINAPARILENDQELSARSSDMKTGIGSNKYVLKMKLR